MCIRDSLTPDWKSSADSTNEAYTVISSFIGVLVNRSFVNACLLYTSSAADSSATAGDSTSVTESKAEGDNSLQKVKDAGQFILGLDATFKLSLIHIYDKERQPRCSKTAQKYGHTGNNADRR